MRRAEIKYLVSSQMPDLGFLSHILFRNTYHVGPEAVNRVKSITLYVLRSNRRRHPESNIAPTSRVSLLARGFQKPSDNAQKHKKNTIRRI